jgi:4'-phosphopantetheinyl transferase
MAEDAAREGKQDPRGEVYRRRIYLGVVDCASTSFDPDEARSLLDPTEDSRLSSFSSDSRKAEFLAGRLLAKHLASSALGIEAKRVSIERGPEGGPYVAGGFSLSIAHSGGVVLCAVARFGVGVDIERIKPRRDIDGIAGYAFAQTEVAALRMQPTMEREKRFYALWTLKEAHVKRLGLGLASLRGGPSFEFGPGTALAATGEGTCAYICFGLGSRFVAAIAYDHLSDEPELRFLPRFAPPADLSPLTLFATSRGERQ